jgi:hypothetical protein
VPIMAANLMLWTAVGLVIGAAGDVRADVPRDRRDVLAHPFD